MTINEFVDSIYYGASKWHKAMINAFAPVKGTRISMAPSGPRIILPNNKKGASTNDNPSNREGC